MVTPDQIVAEVARKHGVLLDQNDPVLLISTMLELHTADHDEREKRLAERDKQFIASVRDFVARMDELGPQPARFDKEQITEISRSLMSRCELWARGALWKANTRAAAIAIAALASMLLIGLGVGWWAFRPPAGYTCDMQRGGYVCYVWLKPATEPFKPMPTPATR